MELNKNNDNESYKIVKDILNEYLTSELSSISKPSNYKKTLKHFVKKTFYLCNNIKLLCLKTLKQHKGDLCGFYTLFYTYYFIKYIESKNPYYLNLMNSRFKFYKFYSKLLKILINKFPTEKETLIKESSLERYHMNYILQNYNELLFPKTKCKFNFIWIDYIMGTFVGEKDNLCSLQNIVSEMKTTSNDIRNCFIFIGISVHWILIHIHSDIKSNKICYNISLFDSFGNSDKILSINVSNEEDITHYIEQQCLEEGNNIPKIHQLSEYEKKSYRDLIKDYHSLFKDITHLLTSNNPFLVGQIVIEYHFKNIINSFFSSLSIQNEDSIEWFFNNSTDKVLILLNIYYWLLTQYHPKIIRENIFSALELVKLKENNEYKLISSSIIKKFYNVFDKVFNFISININAINEEDIKKLLDLFLNVIKVILQNITLNA